LQNSTKAFENLMFTSVVWLGICVD